jgi:hypothetical protein
VAQGIKKQKIYFWQKLALKPDSDEEDILSFYEIIEDDISIREVLREFDSKIIGKKLSFSNVYPENASVKKWIHQIRSSYPERKDEVVSYLLDTFRTSLFPRSKERYRNIVGLLLLNDTLLLLHSKRDRSLAQWNDDIHSANIILYRKNVLRAAILKDEDGKLTFSAFEHNRNWSKGHAAFWGIEPEEVSWDSLGHIILFVKLSVFPYPLQLPMETNELKELIESGEISHTGHIKIGREEGDITHVEILRKYWEFDEFYDFYISENDKLMEHRKKFEDIIPKGKNDIIYKYDPALRDTYQYKEDLEKVYVITPEQDEPIHGKRHMRYQICFFTKEHPRIKPSNVLIRKIYNSIFHNHSLEICHAGESPSRVPTDIGNLRVYNHIDLDTNFLLLSNGLLNIIQDCQSKKTRSILEYYFCSLWNKYLKNKHLHFIFDFIIEEIIISDFIFHFSHEGLCDKENYLEFKSEDDVNSKTKIFIQETLVPTIRKYIKEPTPSRICILYGIEDNGEIKPVSRQRLKSDSISVIERTVNKELAADKVSVIIQPIPYNEDVILAVFIIPNIKKVIEPFSSLAQIEGFKQPS